MENTVGEGIIEGLGFEGERLRIRDADIRLVPVGSEVSADPLRVLGGQVDSVVSRPIPDEFIRVVSRSRTYFEDLATRE
jgi:hypothetical protein